MSEATATATTDAPATPKKQSKSKVPTKYRKRYANYNGTCGDQLSAILAEAKKADLSVVEIGEANGVDVLGRWGGRNVGMQRMNLSNVLRGMVRRGEAVTIGDTVIPGDPQDDTTE